MTQLDLQQQDDALLCSNLTASSRQDLEMQAGGSCCCAFAVPDFRCEFTHRRDVYFAFSSYSL